VWRVDPAVCVHKCVGECDRECDQASATFFGEFTGWSLWDTLSGVFAFYCYRILCPLQVCLRATHVSVARLYWLVEFSDLVAFRTFRVFGNVNKIVCTFHSRNSSINWTIESEHAFNSLVVCR